MSALEEKLSAGDDRSEWLERLATLDNAFYRVIWVAGGSSLERANYLGRIGCLLGVPVLSVGQLLSAALLDIPSSLRAASAEDSFSDLLRHVGSQRILLDRMDILFDQCLRLNAVELVRNASRYFTLIAAWPGSATSDNLIYAPSEHPTHVRILIRQLEGSVHVIS